MSRPFYRKLQLVMIWSTLFVLWVAFYLQYIGGLKPCPLCLMQRFFAFLLAISCLVGLCLSTPERGRFLAVLQIVLTLVGLFLASRQVWLESLPADQVPACMPGLEMLIHYFPWQDVLSALFWGTGECSKVTWTLLGFSMPYWSGLYFLAMLMVSTWIFLRLSLPLNKAQK